MITLSSFRVESPGFSVCLSRHMPTNRDGGGGFLLSHLDTVCPRVAWSPAGTSSIALTGVLGAGGPSRKSSRVVMSRHGPPCVHVRSLCCHFVGSFYYEWLLGLGRCFLCVVRGRDDVIFIPHFVRVLHPLSTHPRGGPTGSRGLILSWCCWMWFAQSLWRIFYDLRDSGLRFSCSALVRRQYRGNHGFAVCLKAT